MHRDLHGRVPSSERNQWHFDVDVRVAGDVVLEVAVTKCLSVVCSLDDPSTGVRHEFRDLSYQGSCVVICKEGYEVGWNISTTFSLCLSSWEFVSEAQTVYSSCSQMLCSVTPVLSGVGVNSSCEGVFIGDTCMVFCAEGYQVVSNETSNLDARVQSMGQLSLSFLRR